MPGGKVSIYANGPVTNSYSLIGQSGLTTFNNAGGARIVVTSSDANDTSSGTGVRKILLSGTDSNGALLDEEITMNGTANVTTTAVFNTLTKAIPSESGDNGIDGDITITNGSATLMKIKADYGRVNDAVAFLDESHYLDEICIYGDSTDSNTVYEINIVQSTGKNDIVLHTIYWNTDKDSHIYPLGGILTTGVVFVRAKNLKHSGPDNISIKLTMSRYDSELDTIEAIRSSSSRGRSSY